MSEHLSFNSFHSHCRKPQGHVTDAWFSIFTKTDFLFSVFAIAPLHLFCFILQRGLWCCHEGLVAVGQLAAFFPAPLCDWVTVWFRPEGSFHVTLQSRAAGWQNAVWGADCLLTRPIRPFSLNSADANTGQATESLLDNAEILFWSCGRWGKHLLQSFRGCRVGSCRLDPFLWRFPMSASAPPTCSSEAAHVNGYDSWM